MRPFVTFIAPLALALSSADVGCNMYSDALMRGQRAFEESEHERALAIFRALEPDVERLPIRDRAHYAYLRGMTDYRIGYKAESRHWLSIASAIDKETPGALPIGWAKRMTESLAELNDAVYSGGIASLSNTPPPATKTDEQDEEDSSSAKAPPPTEP